MPSTRRNVLLVLVIVLTGVLAFRLLLREGGHEPPPHPPLTTGAAKSAPDGHAMGARASTSDAAAARSTNETRYAHDELDLLPLGSSRAGGLVPPPDSRYAGTNSAEAAALRLQANAALAAGDPQAAASTARAGLAIDPDYPQLLVVAAVAALRLPDDHLAEAEQWARQATAASPCYAEAHYNLACALARQRRAADCEVALRAAIEWGREQGMNAQAEARKDRDFDPVRQAPELKGLLTDA